ncbi:MAG TPA: hypothetical protein ENN13_00430 [Candidatus Altiarchaeales archaeon]|nr:hypothetical protein [Candidatus Altiarchaeales archaeon]
MGLYSFIGKMLPWAVRNRYKTALKFSMLKTSPEVFLGKIVVAAMMVAFAVNYFASKYFSVYPAVIFFTVFLIIQAFIYVWVLLSASNKANLANQALPDALQLMSSNIRAGLTTDKALIMAARPEFGPLEEEIRRVGKETMAGKNLAESLSKTSEHIQSTELERAIELIIYSLQSGGQLADLLDETAEDIRNQQLLQKEIRASVLMYVFFIFVAIVLGAPMLFSLSGFLAELLTTNMAMIAKDMPADFGGTGAMPISVNREMIDPGFLINYSLISMVASCLFGSMVIGLIMKGEEKEGLKYILVMIAISVSLYFIGRIILKAMLGEMMVG